MSVPVRTPAGILAPSAAMMAAAFFTAPVLEAWDERRPLQGVVALSGVIGHWSDSTLGAPSLVVNGERWSGQTADGELRQWSTRLFGAVHEGFVRNGSADGAFPIAVAAGAGDFSSGTLRVQFNLLGGKSDQIAGVMFGLDANGDYFYVRYNTRDGNLAVWRVRNSQREVMHHGEVHKQLPLGAWHELVVRVQGRTVSAHVAGDTTIAVSHTLDRDPTGKVGVQVKRDAITAFRGFTVAPSRR